ncbi:MAG: hypothetical protein IJO33_02155 [Bacilli bacterium]|nr:hypothetical protein [Bacilli bacterium]
MTESYLFRNKNNQVAGKITIYKKNLKIKKLRTLEHNFQEFKQLLKTEQFSTLDHLLSDTLDKIANYVKVCNDSQTKLKLQNKYDGLTNLKRKIELAKRDYQNNPHNNLAYNKLINLYNSLRNLL